MTTEGNAEGTPQPGDSVQTARGTSADWSNVQEVYERLGTIKGVAEHYGVGDKRARAELVRHGVEIITPLTRVIDWSDLREVYERLDNMNQVSRHYNTRNETVRAELERQGIPIRPRGHVKGQKKSETWREASRKHWDDPEWRDEQRQRWLERLPGMRGDGSTSPVEQLLHDALCNARISFATHQPLLGRYIADVILTHQKLIVVEADGSSHLLKSAREKDALRDATLRQAGYEVTRVAYRDLAEDPDECVRRIALEFGLAAEDEPVFVISSDAEARGALSRQRWDDPEQRARHTAALSEGQRKRRLRERQEADGDTVGPA